MDREMLEEIKRHFGIVAESLRSDGRAVAEGQQALRDELTRDTGELRREIGGLRSEMRAGFDAVKTAFRATYSELDRRVRALEPKK